MEQHRPHQETTGQEKTGQEKTDQDPNDQTLMTAVAQSKNQQSHAVLLSSQQALDQLMQRYGDSLYTYALRLSQNAHQAEDLCQDTWLRVWQQAASFDPNKSQLNTWLHRVLHNLFVDAYRLAKNKPTEALGLEDFESEVPQMTEQAQSLTHALNNLPTEQRAVLLLKHSQGFSNPEVAQIIGASIRAVESLAARAKTSLRRKLEGTAHDQ